MRRLIPTVFTYLVVSSTANKEYRRLRQGHFILCESIGPQNSHLQSPILVSEHHCSELSVSKPGFFFLVHGVTNCFNSTDLSCSMACSESPQCNAFRFDVAGCHLGKFDPSRAILAPRGVDVSVVESVAVGISKYFQGCVY